MNWLAIEELEAWFLGDIHAVVRTYPRVPETTGNRNRYRNPDSIRGGTWKALGSILQAAGYHSGGLRKIQAARSIAPHLNPAQNRSRSFRGFCDRLGDAVLQADA
jgi:hypothetical protein